MGRAPGPSREEIESQLRGKTLEVYIYMLKHGGPFGIREIQRDLNFSSPSVVVYHTDKLQRLGIIDKDQYGRYLLNRDVDVGVLNAFTNIGRFFLPRLGFYAALFTTLALGYIIIGADQFDRYAIIGIIAAAAAFWYEAWRIWMKRPF